MNKRKQSGSIVAFSGRWYVRYYKQKLIDGRLVRKRVSHLFHDTDLQLLLR